MRFLFWLIVLPLAVLIALFAIANNELVTLAFDPAPFEMQLPLFLVVLAALFAGLLIGGISAWLGQRRWRQQARALNRNVRNLERELTEARARAERPAVPAVEDRRRATGG